MGETLLWFGIFCTWALIFFTVIWPWAVGRLPADRYHEHLRSPEWAATTARLAATRRGKRCAACGTTEDLGQPHHISYTNLGFERSWQLVRLCKRHHVGRWGVHWWAEWLFSSRTRGLWATTALVVGAGKIRQLPHRLGRRPRPATSATIPASYRDGDVIFPADGHVYQRTGTDWQRLDP